LEGLERAVVADVAQLRTRRVERNRRGREVLRISEHERGLGIDEALDEPGRGQAIHVRTPPGDPLATAEVAKIRRGLLSSSGFL
jgi:hypothetical protein